MKAVSFLFFLVFPIAIDAQVPKVAVVDMELAFQSFYKKDREVEAIHQLADEKNRNIDERKAAYAKMTSEMVDLDRIVRAPEYAEERRRDAGAKLKRLADTRAAKAAEIGDAERKAQQELLQIQQEMEDRLLEEIRLVANLVAQENGFDLLFDKSLFPKSSKVIVFTSTRVPDLTNDVISKLNANAPPAN